VRLNGNTVGITQFVQPGEVLEEEEGTGKETEKGYGEGKREASATPDLSKAKSKRLKQEEPGCKSDMEGIERNVRERKATKSNNAEVPEYLWLEHLCEDGDRVWTMDEKARRPKAIGVVQRAMLCRWKIRLRRTFLDWIKEEHPRLAEYN
jgi:hypothetical protein